MSVGFTRARLAAASLAAVACIAVVGAGSASAASLTTVRIAYNPNPSNTTIVVAQNQGYFKKNGIKAVLTASQNTAGLIPALGKQLDICNATVPSVLQAAAHGQSLIMDAGETIETRALPNTYLIAAKNITSIAELKGAKIAVPSLSGTLYESVVLALQKAGVSKSQVTFLSVPFPDMAGDLADGTVQAVNTIVPFNGQLLGEGYKNLGDPVFSVGGGTQLDIGWASSTIWAATHKSVVNGFVKAQEEAYTWIKKNPAATEAILEKDFQLPAVAAEHYPLYQFFSFGLKSAYLTNWIKPMEQVGDLPKGYSPKISSLLF
jgi:NitT/TauT family transport system substrate-binding protein